MVADVEDVEDIKEDPVSTRLSDDAVLVAAVGLLLDDVREAELSMMYVQRELDTLRRRRAEAISRISGLLQSAKVLCDGESLRGVSLDRGKVVVSVNM